MDPLSVTASIIALVQAGSGIAKAVKVLHGFTKARAEFCDFLNEIATLQGILHDIETSLRQLPEKDRNLAVSEPATLPSILADLEDTIRELDDLSQKLMSGSKGRGKDGLHRISKIQWQRTKGDIQSLRDKTRRSRENLGLCFSALQISQGVQSRSTVLEIRGIVETLSTSTEERYQEGLTLVHQHHTELTQTLTSTLEQRYESAIQRGNERLLESLKQIMETPPQKRRIESHDPRQPLSAEPICFNTKLKERCEMNCKCRCHKRSTIQNPQWLRPIMGSFRFNYNSLPVLNPNSCNIPFCKSAQSKSISLQYYFPRWLIARGIHIATTWSSLTGTGASLHLRIPVMIRDDHDIWYFIGNNMAEKVRDYLLTQRLSPNAVDRNGQSLLLYALDQYAIDACQVLVDFGSNASLTSDVAGNAVSRARRILLLVQHLRLRNVRRFDEQRMRTLRHISDSEDEMSLAATFLHDSVLGLENSLPLDLALSADPTAIDAVDGTGMTPLLWAVCIKNEDAVKFLLSNEASPGSCGQDGLPLLHCAASLDDDTACRIAKTLIRAGYDVNSRDYVGRTALHCTTTSTMISTLLESGADPNIADQKRLSAFHWIATNMALWNTFDVHQAILLLRDAGADINAVDALGFTPIDRILLRSNIYSDPNYRSHSAAMFRYYHQSGASFDTIGPDGMILHRLSIYAPLEIIEYLRNVKLVGVDPDEEDINSDTASDHLTRLMNPDTELYVFERRPTPAETLSCMALIVETRESNWEQCQFLYSKEQPDIWERHLREKREVERLWGLVNLPASQSSCKDAEEIRDDEANSITSGEPEDEDNHGGDQDSSPETGSEAEVGDDDPDEDTDSDDDPDTAVRWHHYSFYILTPSWLIKDKAEQDTEKSSLESTNTNTQSHHELDEEDVSDDEDSVFFDAIDGSE